MPTLAWLALSTLLSFAVPTAASAACSDEKGFCPFRDAGAASAAEDEQDCGAMAMAAGEGRGCCGAEAMADEGCCGGAHVGGAGCCGAGAGCAQPEGGSAPQAHPGA